MPDIPKPKPLPPRWVKLATGRCQGNPEGKWRFVGEAVASEALRLVRIRRQLQGLPEPTWERRYYYCNRCSTAGTHAFHLTHLGINETPEDSHA